MTNILVTGGTGFLGMRIISQLLQQGYHVRTTVRSLDSSSKVIEVLQKNNIDTSHLTFAAADLSKDEGWDDAMKEMDYVLSVASPVFFHVPKNEEEVIRPAIEGIQRILAAAKKADIQRVVMTSNFGAVGFSNQNKNSITTEEHWTDVNQKGLSAYEKSKLIAEQEAWKFAKANDIELVTINPVAILGPSLDNHVSGSFNMIKGLVTGSMSRIPNIPLNIVDVRDVADLHIRAMTTPEAAGHRFIASADGQITLQEIAELIRRERPAYAEKISTKKVPDVMLSIGALFNKEAQEGKLLLNMNRNVSNEQAKKILNWTPISTQEQAILASVDSLAQYNLI